MKTKIILISPFLFFFFVANAQLVKYDFNNDLDGWTTTIISNDGEWAHAPNGKADGGFYWNGRDSIHSESGEGAIVCNGDQFITSNPPIGDPTLPYITAIESPNIAIPAGEEIFIKFNQYFRNLNSETFVEVSIDNGMDWISFPINTDVQQNVETSPADIKYINITPPQPSGEIKVRFVFEGDYYFWIIDDVEIYTEDPSPKTFPTRYGDSLTVFGKPFEVDSSNWAYVPNEVVVQFKSNTTPAERQLIRDSLGATLKESCVCDRLELWEFGNAGGDSPSSEGNTIGINEIVKGANSRSKIDGVDVNRYNFNELQNEEPTPNVPITSIPNGIVTPTGDPTLVAILDTGIDYEHPSLLKYIYLNDDELDTSNFDDDDNCLVNDPLGWNFVDDNNNIKDDHSHGTHVAGIVVKNYEEQYGDSCEMKIIGYKTHDSYGTSNLFDVTCATYQALEDSVDVINDSWGFYGDTSIILSNAVDSIRMYDILVITASGNDSLDLSVHPQYPACYLAPNVITVGSLDTIINSAGSEAIINSTFSNYDPQYVDILAPGRNINSTVLDNMEEEKTGTSMSAPAVAAAAAMIYCSGHQEYNWVKYNILNCADKYISLQDTVREGNVLNYNLTCLTPTEELITKDFMKFSLYPNPVNDKIYINALQDIDNAKIELVDINGRILFTQKIHSWINQSEIGIEVINMPPGVYFIKIYSDQNYKSFKVIKL